MFLFVLYLPGPVQLAIFLQICTNCPHLSCILRKCQYEKKSKCLQTSYNHYKCLSINKNGLRLFTNMLRICFSCEFLEHVSHLRKTYRMLTNTPRMLTNTCKFLAIIANWPRIAFVSPLTSIFAYMWEQHNGLTTFPDKIGIPSMFLIKSWFSKNCLWQCYSQIPCLNINFIFNPLYTNGFFLLVGYNKVGIVYCTYLGISDSNFKKNIAFFCLKISFTFTNSVVPDEMQHYAAFHLGLHCLQKWSFRGFPNTKG